MAVFKKSKKVFWTTHWHGSLLAPWRAWQQAATGHGGRSTPRWPPPPPPSPPPRPSPGTACPAWCLRTRREARRCSTPPTRAPPTTIDAPNPSSARREQGGMRWVGGIRCLALHGSCSVQSCSLSLSAAAHACCGSPNGDTIPDFSQCGYGGGGVPLA